MLDPRRFNDHSLEWAIAACRIFSLASAFCAQAMLVMFALTGRLELLWGYLTIMATVIVSGWWSWWLQGNQDWRSRG